MGLDSATGSDREGQEVGREGSFDRHDPGARGAGLDRQEAEDRDPEARADGGQILIELNEEDDGGGHPQQPGKGFPEARGAGQGQEEAEECAQKEAYQQAAGFLRIHGAENVPDDARTGVPVWRELSCDSGSF